MANVVRSQFITPSPTRRTVTLQSTLRTVPIHIRRHYIIANVFNKTMISEIIIGHSVTNTTNVRITMQCRNHRNHVRTPQQQITRHQNIHWTDVEDSWILQLATQNSIVHDAIFVTFYKFLHYNDLWSPLIISPTTNTTECFQIEFII